MLRDDSEAVHWPKQPTSSYLYFKVCHGETAKSFCCIHEQRTCSPDIMYSLALNGQSHVYLGVSLDNGGHQSATRDISFCFPLHYRMLATYEKKLFPHSTRSGYLIHNLRCQPHYFLLRLWFLYNNPPQISDGIRYNTLWISFELYWSNSIYKDTKAMVLCSGQSCSREM